MASGTGPRPPQGGRLVHRAARRRSLVATPRDLVVPQGVIADYLADALLGPGVWRLDRLDRSLLHLIEAVAELADRRAGI